MVHAEIAGAGISGLTAGTVLASSGWTVQIHERGDAIREVGAGIFMNDNGMLVLEELGLMETLSAEGVQLTHRYMRSPRGRVMQKSALTENSRIWMFPRQALIEALYRAADRAGAEIRTNSTVTGADPDGKLYVEDGTTYNADLVIAADGFGSAVRDSLDMTEKAVLLPTASLRYLIPGRDLVPENTTTQFWSGRRRIAITATAPDKTYVYFSCPQNDLAAKQDPRWLESWQRSFPALREELRVLLDHTPFIANYAFARAKSWRSGRVAIIGDAAHALPPTLGQGANLALCNARSLGTFVNAYPSDRVRDALEDWERQARPTSDIAQKWSSRYDKATTHWPRALGGVRSAIIRLYGAWPRLNRQMRIADATPPITSLEKVH